MICRPSPTVEVVVHFSECNGSAGSIDNEPVEVELVVNRDPEDGLEVECVQLLNQPLWRGKGWHPEAIQMGRELGRRGRDNKMRKEDTKYLLCCFINGAFNKIHPQLNQQS